MASLVSQSGRFNLDFFDSTRTPKRKRVPLRVKYKRDAESVARKLERDFSLGVFNPWTDDARTYDQAPQPKPERLSEARAAFLDTKTHMSARTLGEYEQVSGRFVAFVGP
ncbi:MAG TPA: hypothetical protein VF576_13430, partial [Rubricoccaceae bacterium]